MSLTADGGRAVSSSTDHALGVWDLKNGQCLAVAAFEAAVRSLDLRGDTVVVGFQSRRVEVLRLGL